MKEWTQYGYYLVTCRCKTDPIYQSLLQQCIASESDYLSVINKLSPQDRECIERYIALCAELDNRMAQLAYFCHDHK